MLPQSRAIFSDNGVLTDYSRELSDLEEAGAPLAIVAAEDILYIGSDMPFNHRYFQVLDAEKNAQAGTVSIEIWDGSQWRAAVNVLDLTMVGGVPFARAGLILWTPDRGYDWARAQSTEDVPALASLKIYNLFWARVKFSAAFSFTLDYLGHKFSRDSDLRVYYPDLDRPGVRESYFEDAVVSWDSLHVAAAEEIIRDLRARQIIWRGDQILEPDQFRDAGSHKVAEMIYSPGGLNQPEHMDGAVAKYKEAMSKLNFVVDKDGTGKIQPWTPIPTSRVRRR